MKKLFKILLRIFMLSLLIILAVFAIRWINNFRYQEYMLPEAESVYVNPADLSLYDTEIEGIEIEIIEEELLNGFHLIPDKMITEGAIVTFGGSDGSSNYDLAKMLAEEGYEVYSLFFFGPGELPDELIEAPLELFEEFLAYYSENSQTDGPLTVLGASKGAELTLNLAAHFNEIDHIILYAPSAYSFFSLDERNTNQSSWMYEEQAIPYLSSRDGDVWETVKMIGGFIFYYPVKYTPVYEAVIDGTNDSDLEAARIKVENFAGDGLIFAGEDDLMWPSQEMANVISQYNDQIKIYFYPEAGHLFTMDRYMGAPGALIAFGGHQEANKRALEKSNHVLFEHLAEWHNQ